MGMAQVMEAQPAVLRPQVGQLGLAKRSLPDPGEVVARQRAAITARAARGGEDPREGATADQLAMGTEHIDGLLIQGDRADPRLGLGALLHAAARPVRVAERPRDPHPPRPADRTVVPRRAHAQMVLASRSPIGMSQKTCRMRFATFFLMQYSEHGCCSFQAGHHLVVTYS